MISTSQELDDILAAGGGAFVHATDGLHLLAAPSLDDGVQVRTLMPHGAAFTATGNSRLGFVEGTFDGQSGWAFAEFLAPPERDFSPGRVATVMSIEGLNLRAEPSLADGVEVLTLMPNGAAFTLSNGRRLGFVEGIFNGLQGWAFGEFLDDKRPTPALPGGKALFEAMRAANMTITQGRFMPPTHSNCDCFDFGIAIGTPIPALAGGKVIFSAPVTDVYRPNKVTVRTELLGDHTYAHLSQRHVSVGETVQAGTILGLSGTENGPHLHLQLEGGFSQLGLNLRQILEREGFDLDAFPRLFDVLTIAEAGQPASPRLF